MATKTIRGQHRILKRWDGAAYKPLVCLTSTDFSQALEMIEKVNVCTKGEVESRPDRITRSVSFSGEVVDTSTLEGGMASGETINELYEVQDAYITGGEIDSWSLEGVDVESGITAKYFNGYLSDASDSYGEGDATFSGTITINGVPTAVNPNE